MGLWDGWCCVLRVWVVVGRDRSRPYLGGLNVKMYLILQIIVTFYCRVKKKLYLCNRKSRGGAVVARWAHNPEVVGSNPAPATNTKSFNRLWLKLLFFIALKVRIK